MPITQVLLTSNSTPPPPPPQDVIDAVYSSDNNYWTYLGSNQGTGVLAGATNAVYTYPDDTSGATLNFTSGDWMMSNNLNVGNQTWSNNAISINMWFYPTAYDVQLLSELGQNIPDPFVGGDAWDGGYHLTLLEIDSNGFVKARFYQGALPGTVMTSSTKIILNQWNHIFLAEATNGVHTFEVNGIPPLVGLPEYTRVKPGTTKYFVVGADDTTNMGTTGRFQGKLGTLEIHDYVASSTFSTGFNKYRPTPLVQNLDAGDVNSYIGPGSTTWTDTVLGTPFDFFATSTIPTYSSDAGGCIVFDAASGAYARSLSSPLTANRWTVEVWHYWDGTNTGSNPCIMTERFTAGNINYALGALDGGTNSDLQAGYFVSSGGWLVTPTGYSLSAGNWYHIVGTYDGTNIKLYINSALQQTTAAGYVPLSSQSGINLMRRWDNPDCWGGKLAQMRLYRGALSATNITANFNAEKSRYGL